MIPFQMEKINVWDALSDINANAPLGSKSTLKDNNSANKIAQTAESILKDATAKIEYLVAEASTVFLLSPNAGSNNSISSVVEDLSIRASSVFNSTDGEIGSGNENTEINVEFISKEIVAATQKIAKESGVDFNVKFATDRAKEVTEYAVGVAATANMVLESGYAYGSRSGAAGVECRDYDINYLAAAAATQMAGVVLSPQAVNQKQHVITPADANGSTAVFDPPHQRPLFGNYPTAQRIEPYEYDSVLYKGAETAALAGA